MPDIADISHFWGQDLQLSVTGDLLAVVTADRAEQRAFRRLMTSPPEYIHHPTYGGSLPLQVGAVSDTAKVKARIIAQLRLESAVASDPAPAVTVRPIDNGIYAGMRFNDAQSNGPVALSFNVDDEA